MFAGIERQCERDRPQGRRTLRATNHRQDERIHDAAIPSHLFREALVQSRVMMKSRHPFANTPLKSAANVTADRITKIIG